MSAKFPDTLKRFLNPLHVFYQSTLPAFHSASKLEKTSFSQIFATRSCPFSTESASLIYRLYCTAVSMTEISTVFQVISHESIFPVFQTV